MRQVVCYAGSNVSIPALIARNRQGPPSRLPMRHWRTMSDRWLLGRLIRT